MGEKLWLTRCKYQMLVPFNVTRCSLQERLFISLAFDSRRFPKGDIRALELDA